MVKVKICGITNYQDASIAVKLGADALGFIFAPSPREITPEKALDIISAIPPFVKTVGVFVNKDPAAIKEIIPFCGLDLVQLHGDESPDVCRDLLPYTIKAFRVEDKSGLSMVRPYQGRVRALLLDTYSEEVRGGTGKTFDWNLAVTWKDLGVPVILSGGLGPSNIESAVSSVKPYSVDVNSGIEEYPGKKDHVLMKELMDKIKRINSGRDFG